MDRGPSNPDFNDRYQAYSQPPAPRKESALDRFLGRTEAREEFNEANERLWKQAKKARRTQGEAYDDYGRTLSKFFKRGDQAVKMEKLRNSLNITEGEIKSDPGATKAKMLRKLRTNKRRAQAQIIRKYRSDRRKLWEEISSKYSNGA